MENFTNIAFWIAFFFGFVQVKSHPVKTDSKLIDIQKNVICPIDSKFYAPANVRVECITTALDCILREFNGTVTEECKDPYEYIEQEVAFLNGKLQALGHVLTDSTECDCEKFSEVPFSEFLKKTQTFLQYVNSVSRVSKVASV